MDKEVEANALLEADDVLDLLLDELLVLGHGDLLLVQLRTRLTNLLGLGEGADGRRGELGELQLLLLDVLADGEGALALEHVGGDRSDPVANGCVRVALELTTLRNGHTVCLDSLGDLGVLGARENGGDDGDLSSLLEGEGKPVLLLGSELVLRRKGNRSVEEGGRCSNDDALLAEGVSGLLRQLERSLEVGLPDVTAGDETERKGQVRRFDSSDDLVKLTRSTVEVNVKTSDGELSNERQVRVEAAIVGRKDELGGDRGKLGICLDKLLLEERSRVEDEDGLVDLDRLDTSRLQVSEELLVDGEKLGKERNGLEARASLLGSLAEREEGNGTNDDGAGGDTEGLSLVVLLESLVEVELELGLPRELGNNKVVVRVKPARVNQKLVVSTWRWNLPFLHLRSGDIDTLSLATTAHSEVDIEGRETLAKVTLGNDVERRRVVKDVVVEGEVTANRINESIKNPRRVRVPKRTWG